MPLNDSIDIREERENFLTFFNISFESNMYDYACLNLANYRKFIFFRESKEDNYDVILQDTSVKAVLLDDLCSLKYNRNASIKS